MSERIERWEVEIIHADSGEWMTVELGEGRWEDEPPLTKKEVIDIIKDGLVFRAKFIGVE